MSVYLQSLELFSDSGVDVLLEDKPVNQFVENNNTKNIIKDNSNKQKLPATKNSSPITSPIEAVEQAKKIANSANNIEELKESLISFDGCSLKKTAINTVMYDGTIDSKIMLIGEAPGADEDRHGIPFCGASGQLLDNMLKFIDLSRKDNIYITNTIFWRPPGNRRPTSEEINICRPFLDRQIELIKPELIILVGGTAVSSVLDSKLTISKARGRFDHYINEERKLNIPTAAIFHPSYLLRSPIQKKKAWFDLLKIKEFIEGNL